LRRLITPTLAAFAFVASANAGEPDAELRPVGSAKLGLEAKVPKGWTPNRVDSDAGWVFSVNLPRPNSKSIGWVYCTVQPTMLTLEDHLAFADKEPTPIPQYDSIVAKLVKNPRGDRLDILRRGKVDEKDGSRVIHREVDIFANRQTYNLNLFSNEAKFAEENAAFDAMLDSIKFSPPDVGCDLVDKARNRWVHRRYGFAIELPEGWSPILDPNVAFHAVASADDHLGYSRRRLVIEVKHTKYYDIEKLASGTQSLDDTSPPSKVLKCAMVAQGEGRALEVLVKGPFEETKFGRRVQGGQFHYVLTYKVATASFKKSETAMRKSLDSFRTGTVKEPPSDPDHFIDIIESATVQFMNEIIYINKLTQILRVIAGPPWR
jgi:hypothetical protein